MQQANSPANITGVAALLNSGNKAGALAAERKITSASSVPVDQDEVSELQRKLSMIGKELDVSFDEVEGAPTRVRFGGHGYDGPDDDDASDAGDVGGASRGNLYSSNAPLPRTREYAHVTDEHKRQQVLNAVIGSSSGGFSVEKEREEDDKLSLLEEIDSLLTNLKDEGIDVSRVPVVTPTSSISDIRQVHRILRLKNDRKRYCSLAEDVILAGSYALEWAFDGKKEYLGYKPDLGGWPATVGIKLRRMRYDTSTLVSNAMREYDMGSATRIALELVPSMFLYSKMRTSQHDDTLTQADVDRATDNLQSLRDDANSDS